MICNGLRMSSIESPLTEVFGVCFVLVALTTGLGNLSAVLVFLQPSQRSRSNVLLMALALSDMTVGFIQTPMIAIQMFSTFYRNDCVMDTVRAYFTILCCGSSVLTLSIVAIDRYILLTRFEKYHKIMTKRNTICMLLMAWIFPAFTPVIKFAGSVIYVSTAMIIFYGPFIILAVSYFFIGKAVREKEKVVRELQKNQLRGSVRKQSNGSLNVHDVNNAINGNNKYVPNKTKTISPQNLKLAKIVAVLIFVYLCCITPLNLWMVFNIINDTNGRFVAKATMDHLYVFAMLGVSLNSCLNPVVYISRSRDFRQSFAKLVRRRLNSNTMSSYVEPTKTRENSL